MTQPFSRSRRFALVLAALSVAAAAFRPQLAQALIVRGDDYLYRGDVRSALVRYERALALSPDSQTAADRYVFLSMQQNTARSLHSGIEEATTFLARHPGNATLLSDRALCYLHEHDYALAQADFERAASGVDAQGYVFAGWAAWHAGRVHVARRLWEHALLLRPRYRPAVIALEEHSQ
jgi:tetratricopeptide (TPR) repeat protein